jgi:hypothetical protein
MTSPRSTSGCRSTGDDRYRYISCLGNGHRIWSLVCSDDVKSGWRPLTGPRPRPLERAKLSPGAPSPPNTVARHAQHLETIRGVLSGATRRRDERLGCAIVVGHLVEHHRYGRSPEGHGGVVAGSLVHVPTAREPGKHRSCGQQTDPAPAVLPHYEELPELVRHSRTHQRTTTDLTVDVDQERMPLLLRKPVVVQVRVAVLTMRTEVTTIDLGEVVRVELEQSPDHRLVTFERWNQPNIHANNLPESDCRHDTGPRRRTPDCGSPRRLRTFAFR